MLPNEIITTAREWSNTPSTVVSDSIALRYLNMRKDDLWSAFVSRADVDFNWEEWTTDTVALQSEYSIPTVTRTTIGAKAIHGVHIAYTDETLLNTGSLDYAIAREVSTGSLKNPWSWYVENQPSSDPIYRVGDSSVFIAPAPLSSEAGTGRLKLIGVRNIPDFTVSGVDGATSTTTEALMRFPLDRQKTLALGLCADLARYRQKSQEAADWDAQYSREKGEYVSQASQRTATSFTAAYPEDGNVPTSPFANSRI